MGTRELVKDTAEVEPLAAAIVTLCVTNTTTVAMTRVNIVWTSPHQDTVLSLLSQDLT